MSSGMVACRYGLGQTYELLRMFNYALDYYRKATALRPFDSRMWCALGGCYEELGRMPDALRCYKRATAHDDLCVLHASAVQPCRFTHACAALCREGIAALRVARLLRDSNDDEGAAKYYTMHLEHREAAQVCDVRAPCVCRLRRVSVAPHTPHAWHTVAECGHYRLCGGVAVPRRSREGPGRVGTGTAVRHTSAGTALCGAWLRSVG